MFLVSHLMCSPWYPCYQTVGDICTVSCRESRYPPIWLPIWSRKPPDPNTQTIIYVPLIRLQKNILPILQYKYLKSLSGEFFLQHLILRTRSCGAGFITQSSWVFHFHSTMVCGNVLYHSCTSFQGASLGGQPLIIFTWSIGAGGSVIKTFESRVFIENWKWVSKGYGSYLVHPGKPLAFPSLLPIG